MADEFLNPTKEILKKRAAFICSNPTCKIMTVAPSVESDEKIQYIGKAAHITAASPGGPRYDDKISSEERKSVSNGIFLCSNCADMIDKNDGIDYKVSTLKDWKENHEKWILENLNKKNSRESPTYHTESSNQKGGITAGVINVNGFDNKPNKKIEHDIIIFKKSDLILNEDNLEVIFQSLLGDESLWTDKQDKLEQFKWFFEKTANEYLNDEIQRCLEETTISLKKLLLFLLNEFDMFPYDQSADNGFRICMRPELNVDRRGTGRPEEHIKHRDLYLKLRNVVNELENNYKKYRKTIKIELYI